MTAAARRREPFMPPRRERRTVALALSLLAHGLLVGALAFGVHWRNSKPNDLSAELWSAVPTVGARRAVEPGIVAPAPPPPPPQQAPAKPPDPAPEPTPAPRPAPPVAEPDPQIAVEQARRAAAARAQAEHVEQQRQLREQEQQRQRAAEEQQRKQAQEQKAKAAQAQASQAAAERADKAQAAALAAQREHNLQRIKGMAGASGDSDTATAARSAGPSASYAGRIRARIKPNIVFSDDVQGNPLTTVEVTLAPDGTIVGKRLAHASGVKSWDDAVMRAIERTEVLPRDVDGRVPPKMEIDFKPHD